MGDWVTPQDVITSIGSPSASYTADDIAYLELVCDSVSAAITMWRPDLTPPPPVQDVDGNGYIALQRQGGGDPVAAACVAAIQCAKKWFEKRGNSNVSGYGELGYIPTIVRDADLAAMLQIGVMSLPIAI